MLRRPPDRAALHFYAICLLFFLMYSTSYTGKLDFADWTLLWTDHLAILLLPVVFLHFCLSFPERKLPTLRGWLIPAAYFPALFLAGASVASQILFVTSARGELLWRITSAIDRSRPLYFAALFALSFGILLHSYRRTHGVDQAQADEVAGVGHGRRHPAVLLLLRDPLCPGTRAALRDGARGMGAPGADTRRAGLRGGQAPPDGRGAHLPAGARVPAGHGGDRRDLPPRGAGSTTTCCRGARSPTSASSPSCPRSS